MRKIDKIKNIRSSFRLVTIIPAFVLLVMLAIFALFISLYMSTDNRVFLFVLIGLLVFLGAGYIVLCFFAVKFFYRVFYFGLYEVTGKNLRMLADGRSDLEHYPMVDILEVKELNEKTEHVKTVLENAYLVTHTPDFSKIDLEYIDEKKHLITIQSMRKNMPNLIFLSQSFRNVIIEVYYEFEEGELSPENEGYILNVFYNTFKDYKNFLFAFRENHRSLLIYLPVIDNFSRIEELLTLKSKDLSVTSRGMQGIVNIPARFAVVAYPYSSEDSILSDLRYAKRQNKVINFFLPNRTKNNVDQRVLMHTSMNINYMSRLLASLSEMHNYVDDDEEDRNTIRQVLNDLTKYLDINEAGIILFQDDVKEFRSYVKTEDSTLFPEKKLVPIDFIDAFADAVDDDNSYYFSSRNHANISVGKMLDYYGISSGYFYVIKNDDQVIGLIYLLNKDKNLDLDAYLRESLFILSLRLAHHFESIELVRKLDKAKSEANYVLSIGRFGVYRVDDELHITDFSPNIKDFFPNAKVGEYCYKALMGEEKQCRDCLMKTFKKRQVVTKKGTLEMSLTLNDRKSHNRAVLVEKVASASEYEPDLYNKDLLCYSFSSLVNTMRDAYYSKGRGYLLLLSIDNFSEILDIQGSEGFNFVVRCLIRKIKNKLKTPDVYVYNPSTLAVLFPNIGHADVITKCEQIYELSKEHYFDDGSDDSFKLTYLPLSYPRGYATADDFLRHVNDFFYSDKCERGKDFIYFFDHDISRSASKREFMLSVIESEFSGKMSQSVNLQPMVVADTKKIYGAEILLRINDVHRNVFFSAQDIARIALQENKTHLITESIVNYVGTLYKENGSTVFKINDFKRVAINIDQTYFKNPDLIKSIIDIYNNYHLPSNFLSFEIPEEMIPDNLDKIRSFSKELASIHIIFSCDRYSGHYVGIEKLKELGFKEIKVMKGVIDGIDKDPQKLNAFKQIAETAKAQGVGISVVGVENEAQYKLLRDIDKNMLLQGYYFYKPLTKSDFLSAIISYN